MATVALGRYLWERIHQLGVNHIFGVPGDFNLTLLDHIYNVDGLEWTGNTNELNAAYAADGYARIKGAACLVTTHGVGELSALNAIAGSKTERIKVIHVVGQTSTKMQQANMMIHHSIGFKPDHQIFNNASREFRYAAAELQTAEGAAEEIDRVLRECIVQCGPVYVFVPIDLVDKEVPADALKTPLDVKPEEDPKATSDASEKILQRVQQSSNPAIFIDSLVRCFDAVDETRTIVKKLGFPVYSSNMGKGVIDETDPQTVGIYNGLPSAPGIADVFAKHDLVIVFGNLKCDTNSGGFTRVIDDNKAIYINHDDVTLSPTQQLTGVPFRSVIQKLASSDVSSYLPKNLPANPKTSLPTPPPEPDHASPNLTQSHIWHRLAASFQPHDVILGETGTAAFGLPDATFPAKCTWLTQTYYGSIGWATPAAVGVDLALRDLHTTSQHPRGRTLLVTGDGSMMLTVQELGNAIKLGLKPLIILINNAGYTIERVIHGARQSYNDIVQFDYAHMLPFLSGPGPQGSGPVSSLSTSAIHQTQSQPNTSPSTTAYKPLHFRASTKVELDALLQKEELINPQALTVLELVLDPMDVPWRLSSTVALRGPEAVQELREAGFAVRELGQEKGRKGFWE